VADAPDPGASFRWLGDEIEDDIEEREAEASNVVADLSWLEQLIQLFAYPEWRTFETYLRDEFVAAQQGLESVKSAPTIHEVGAYRGRIRALRHLLELPEDVHKRYRALSARLGELERKPEEGEEETP
jgi:hypothetical protein